ncbi:DegT/DnrJ/EryC1/StrS family aminotransferase [Parasphingorhabdus litoris]|uniref:DegT/DnrJ/EryC1/StrS family aminotransferase n=1 Tax=Parasphingorhabdus litoris TaxID=394733 RepID=A0ABP3KB18_9SPHN|nr:DegT/DnrJ/EryC1/StrS family aminotransferase [Parasphingorhabdus litoris]
MTQEARQIPIALPSIGEDEIVAVREALRSGWITQGPRVAEFESAFAVRHQVNHAFAVTSCTTATHLALVAAGVGPGDEVLVPAFTWVSTANVVIHCGAVPIFVDVDPATNNIMPSDIAHRITDRTKAIIPVHLFGLCADIEAIKAVLPDHVVVIEDAACAAGASYHGRPAGSLGDIGAFSFHPRKSITTGEGGMVTTNNSEYAARIDSLRNHGASISEEQRHNGPRPYILPEFEVVGFNYRMTDLQGAVGAIQIKKLDEFISERNNWAQHYMAQLADVDWLVTPKVPDNYSHAWQSFVTFVNPDLSPTTRNEMMDKLQKTGVATRPGTHAVHMLGAYRDRFDIKPEDYPGALSCNNNTMAIPLHNKMIEEDYAYVIKAIKSI